MSFTMCSRCILDTGIASVKLDENGVCNYCHKYDEMAARTIGRDREKRYKEFAAIVKRMKEDGRNKKYDCILGLSGGMDSSYLALITKEYGLRPLVVHFDNGWNSELAVSNIENIVKTLGYDLYTYVIDWEAFKELQRAYIKASVVDIEVPTDQLIFSALYKIAKENKIKYILSGFNVKTEEMLPVEWYYMYKSDYRNLVDIFNQFGNGKLPKKLLTNYYRRQYYQKISGIQSIPPLFYLDFDLKEVKQRLQNEVGWRPYPNKHFESIFTRFYQGYMLPVKFGIDKRKAHLSSLVVSGLITREEALAEYNSNTYPEEEKLADREYVTKKLGFSNEEFNSIMSAPRRDHGDFKSDNNRSFTQRLFDKGLRMYLKYLGYPLKLQKRLIETL
jgi:N-acetyl sugar amidotransferase